MEKDNRNRPNDIDVQVYICQGSLIGKGRSYRNYLNRISVPVRPMQPYLLYLLYMRVKNSLQGQHTQCTRLQVHG